MGREEKRKKNHNKHKREKYLPINFSSIFFLIILLKAKNKKNNKIFKNDEIAKKKIKPN